LFTQRKKRGRRKFIEFKAARGVSIQRRGLTLQKGKRGDISSPRGLAPFRREGGARCFKGEVKQPSPGGLQGNEEKRQTMECF